MRARGSLIVAAADRRLAQLGIYRYDARPLVKLKSLLVAIVALIVALFALKVVVAPWHDGSGSVGDVLWWIVRVLYSLAKLTLIVVLIATIRQWFVSRRSSSGRAPVARADRAIRWRQVPWSLWAYVILTTGGMVVAVAIASAPVAPSVFFVGFILAWNYLLLRGLRWLWIGTAVLSVCFFGVDLLTGTGTWHGDVLGVIELGLLLAPPTRRFFSAGNPQRNAGLIPPR